MYYALQWPDETFNPNGYLYYAYPTREEANRANQIHTEYGDPATVLELPGILVVSKVYGETKRIKKDKE